MYRSPEDRFIGGISGLRDSSMGRKNQKTDLTQLEKNIIAQYQEYDQKRPDHLDFMDIFKKEVPADSIKLAEAKKGEQEQTERGKLLERIVFEEGIKSGWFGDKDVALVPVSDFDDHFSHGDMVLEIKDEEGNIQRILLDITTSIDEGTLRKKMARGIKNAENGVLCLAKYFRSELEQGELARGRKTNMAKAVIGVNPTILNELCEEIRVKGKGKLQENPVQLMFIDEIINQLENHIRATTKNKDEKHFAVKQNLKILNYFKKLSENKKSLRTRDYAQKANSDWTFQHLSC